MLELRGRFAPIVTPFTDDGSGVSEIRLARLVRKLQGNGVEGFVVGSEAGEFPSLALSERKDVLEITLRECQGALPVVAHVSTLSTTSSLDLAQHAGRHGARAVMLMPPYYPNYTQTEIEWHIRTVAQYSDLPIIVTDPHRQIGEGVRDTLTSLGRFLFPAGSGRSDACNLGEMNVDISAALPMPLETAPRAELGRLGLELGSAKVLKTALVELDIEVGPLRKPLENLLPEDRRRVEALVASG